MKSPEISVPNFKDSTSLRENILYKKSYPNIPKHLLVQPQQALCTKLLESTAHSTAKAWRDFPKPILLRGRWAREVGGSGPIKRHKFKKCVFSMWKEMKVLSKHVSNSQSLETYMDIIYMSLHGSFWHQTDLKRFSLFTAEDRICKDAPTILRNRLKPCFNPDPVTPWLDLCGQKFWYNLISYRIHGLICMTSEH